MVFSAFEKTPVQCILPVSSVSMLCLGCYQYFLFNYDSIPKKRETMSVTAGCLSFIAFKSRTWCCESQVITQHTPFVLELGVFTPRSKGKVQSCPSPTTKSESHLFPVAALGKVKNRRNGSYFWFRERTENWDPQKISQGHPNWVSFPKPCKPMSPVTWNQVFSEKRKYSLR